MPGGGPVGFKECYQGLPLDSLDMVVWFYQQRVWTYCPEDEWPLDPEVCWHPAQCHRSDFLLYKPGLCWKRKREVGGSQQTGPPPLNVVVMAPALEREREAEGEKQALREACKGVCHLPLLTAEPRRGPVSGPGCAGQGGVQLGGRGFCGLHLSSSLVLPTALKGPRSPSTLMGLCRS